MLSLPEFSVALFLLFWCDLWYSPMPLWLTTGRPHHDGSTPSTVLSEEQFNRLPEITYKGAPARSDMDPHEERRYLVDAATTTASSTTEVKSGADEISEDINPWSNETSNGGEVDDVESGKVVVSENTVDDKEPTPEKESAKADTAEESDIVVDTSTATKDDVLLEERDSLQNDAAKQTKNSADSNVVPETTAPSTAEEQTSDELPKVKNNTTKETSETMADVEIKQFDSTQTAPDIAASDGNVKEDSSSTTSSPIFSAEPEVVVPPAEVGQGSTAAPTLEASSTPIGTTESGNGRITPLESNNERETISTSCAICIDEFEFGEKLTLLPRCRHAFHRECIHEWLTERQGCCPLCKVDVLEPDPEEAPGELDLEAPAEQRFMISSM